MSTIQFPMGGPIRQSRNLRGLLDYAREFAPVCIVTRKTQDDGGSLRVIYADGSIGAAQFVCYAVMREWVQARRSWRITCCANTRHII